MTENWMPSPSVRSEMQTECPHVNFRTEHKKFIDYWMAKSGRDATKIDWDRTWRNWIRTAAERTGAKPLASVPLYRETEAPDPDTLPWKAAT